MRALSLIFSPSGRLAPKPFAIAVTLLYIVNFLSQPLLSTSVTGQAGLWAFAVLQLALVWSWVVLHRKRLRDAGRSSGLAYGIACLYVLALILVMLVIVMIAATEASTQTMQAGQGLIRIWIVLYLFAMLMGSPEFSTMSLWLLGFAIVLMLPMLIAFGYSLWAATRPRLPVEP